VIDAASAQTVVVRKAPSGSEVEVVLNGKPVGSAKANADGDAVVPMDLAKHGAKPEFDAQVSIEICGEKRRVLVSERGGPASPIDESCERRDLPGVFLVRNVSTLVMGVGGANPTLLLIQGSYSLEPQGPGSTWQGTPNGLVLFGGAGLSTFGNASTRACGSVAPCDTDDWGTAFAGGVTFWVSPYLAAEASYMKPGDSTASGGDETYRFDSFLDAEIVTIGGKVGVPFGPVRIYGNVGANYHRATFGTTQTAEEVTITIGGEEQTIPGGTQRFELKTRGWGWAFGGGLEAWITRNVGVYGEFGRTKLKGKNADDGTEGEMDDAVTSIMVGIRLHIGR
jgi:hypothetical protein